MPLQAQFSGYAISLLQGYASNAFHLAGEYMDDLHDYIVATIDTTPPSINVDVPASIVIDPSLGSPPDAPPNSAYPAIPDQPATQEFDFPTKPAYSLPVAPVLTDIVLPSFIEGTIDPLTTSMPEIDFDVPNLSMIQDGGQAPEDELVQAAKAKLLSNIVNGGTMLNPQVEADLWNRDRERRVQALQDMRDKITAQWAKLGWSLPDGLLAGQLLAAETEYLNKDLDSSREIAVKQADLEQKGMFESLKLGIDLETVLMANYNDYAKRVFEASKATVDVTIELYKQRVVQYNTMLEAFKTDVLAYKTKIEAELGRAEVYKARLAGAELLTKIDDNRVKLYISHMSAIEQLVKIYQTEVQSVAIMYEAEKQKIDGFKARVEAYTAVVEGITKKYLGEMEGYKSYVTAWAASADAQTKFGDLKLKGEVAELEATLKAWEIQMKIVSENTTTKLEALKTVATTSSNLAAGALSAIHASVSDAYSYQDQITEYFDLSPNA
jgi:hypothetical protein